jgi:hypothetical protein
LGSKKAGGSSGGGDVCDVCDVVDGAIDYPECIKKAFITPTKKPMRYYTLYALTSHLRQRKIPKDLTEKKLKEWNLKFCIPPHSDKIVQQAIEGGYKKDKSKTGCRFWREDAKTCPFENREDCLFYKKTMLGSVITETEIGPTTKVVLTDRGIFICNVSGIDEKTGKKTWSHHKVYIGKFDPVEKLVVDETTVVRYTSVGEQLDDFSGIVRRMRKDGGIVSKNRIEDAVNAVCVDLPTRTGHATLGVYENNGKLKLCMDSLPIKEAQKRVKMRGVDAINQELTKETLKNYIDLIKYWHPYEILPSMGVGAIAPFALMLRKKNYLICHIVHFSPAPKLGKSTVHHAYSRYLFHIFPVSGDSIGSRYRFSAAIDSICGYLSVDEAENINWRDMTDLLKESPENYICNIRGTPDQSVTEYHSRAVLGINCNRFKINEESVLVRILKIEFDNTLVSERGGNPERVDELKQILDQLRPIGWRLVDLELEDLKFSFDELIKRIGAHAANLKKRYRNFIDPRRVDTYAVMYEGLKIWERASIKYGLKWRTPSYDNFITDVIDKIERTTEESGEPVVVDFFHWWEMWKVKNTRKVYMEGGGFCSEIIGEDIIWTGTKTIEHGDKKYKGDVVTGAILREYKGDRQSKIDSLSDIAKVIEQQTGIPKDTLYKRWYIGENTRWGVFTPVDIWKFKGSQTDIEEYDEEKIDGEQGKNKNILEAEERKNVFLNEIKQKIRDSRKAGYKIDDDFLYKNFDNNVINGALASDLIIKKDDKEYYWWE